MPDVFYDFTGQIMKDPVTVTSVNLTTGEQFEQIYDRESIRKWMSASVNSTRPPRCPRTNKPLVGPHLSRYTIGTDLLVPPFTSDDLAEIKLVDNPELKQQIITFLETDPTLYASFTPQEKEEIAQGEVAHMQVREILERRTEAAAAHYKRQRIFNPPRPENEAERLRREDTPESADEADESDESDETLPAEDRLGAALAEDDEALARVSRLVRQLADGETPRDELEQLVQELAARRVAVARGSGRVLPILYQERLTLGMMQEIVDWARDMQRERTVEQVVEDFIQMMPPGLQWDVSRFEETQEEFVQRSMHTIVGQLFDDGEEAARDAVVARAVQIIIERWVLSQPRPASPAQQVQSPRTSDAEPTPRGEETDHDE